MAVSSAPVVGIVWSMDMEYPEFGTIIIDGTSYNHDVVVDGGLVSKKGPQRGSAANTGTRRCPPVKTSGGRNHAWRSGQVSPDGSL